MHIIDFMVDPPLAEFVDGFLKMGGHMKNFGRIFTYEKRLETVKDFIGLPKEKAMSRFIELLEENGIERAAFYAKDVESTFGSKIPNELISDLVAEYPKFLGFAGADPHKSLKAVKELDHALSKLNLVGLHIWPGEQKLRPNDPKYYPLYAKCVEYEAPVWIHCSNQFSTEIKMDFGRPGYLDDVAMDFPDLKIVAGHGGWPWVNEMVALLWRHPNLYTDISSIRPKYIGTPGTGWEMLLRYGGTVLQDKIIFATGWPMVDIKTAVSDMMSLPLKESVRQKWMYDNAAKLLKLK